MHGVNYLWHLKGFLKYYSCQPINLYGGRMTPYSVLGLSHTGRLLGTKPIHYIDVIMSAIASQVTGVSIVCSTIRSGADQRKLQSSASLAFVWGIHRWPVNSTHKRPVTRKIFSFDHVIMNWTNDNQLCSETARSNVSVIESKYYDLNWRNAVLFRLQCVNSSLPGQNGHHFADNIFLCILMNGKFCVSIPRFTEVYYQGSNLQEVSIGAGNGLVLNRRQGGSRGIWVISHIRQITAWTPQNPVTISRYHATSIIFQNQGTPFSWCRLVLPGITRSCRGWVLANCKHTIISQWIWMSISHFAYKWYSPKTWYKPNTTGVANSQKHV